MNTNISSKSILSHLLLTFVSSFSLLLISPANPLPNPFPNVVFPPDAGVVNVCEAYGLKGDGVTDNSDALQKAFDELKGQNRTLYFPNGTYLISKPIGIFGAKAHTKDRFIHLQGQSRDGVIIRLKDRSPDFQDPNKPKILLSLYQGAHTNDAMATLAANFTIDVGVGNPGAIAFRFMANNTGGCYDIVIRSSDPNKVGAIGLDLTQNQQGPCLIKRVYIEGFDYGIAIGNTFSVVLEHIFIKDQKKAGLFNASGGARITLRGLTSINQVPAIQLGKSAHLTLLEAKLQGGTVKFSAIESISKKLFLRDVQQSGYEGLLKLEGKVEIPSSEVKEWTPTPVKTLFDAPKESLRLPILETPEVPWETDLTKWVQVKPSSEVEGKNPLQVAIDEANSKGATTVYFSSNTEKEAYVLRSPVRVYGSVRRIIGMQKIIWVDGESPDFPPESVLLTFENTQGPVVFERFFNIVMYKGWKGLRDRYLFAVNTEHPVIIRDLSHGALLHNKPSPGRTWFSENVTGYVRVGPGEKVWLRQYNPESPDLEMLVADGAQVWILGLKTEGRSIHIVAKNGAKVELLGGVSYQSWKNQPLDPPTFKIEDSEVSLTLGFYHYNLPFTTIVEETRKGETKKLPRTDLDNYHLPLYRSAK